jgi:hypothetical protein
MESFGIFFVIYVSVSPDVIFHIQPIFLWFLYCISIRANHSVLWKKENFLIIITVTENPSKLNKNKIYIQHNGNEMASLRDVKGRNRFLNQQKSHALKSFISLHDFHSQKICWAQNMWSFINLQCTNKLPLTCNMVTHELQRSPIQLFPLLVLITTWQLIDGSTRKCEEKIGMNRLFQLLNLCSMRFRK